MQQEIYIQQESPAKPRNRALIEDLDELMSHLYPTESNHLMAPEELAKGLNKFFVASIKNDIVGCGAIIVGEADYSEIKRIFVMKTARKLGVAKSILCRLEVETKKLGLSSMKLETGTLQPDAIRLFERFGFSRCTAFGNYSESDLYSYFMEKIL